MSNCAWLTESVDRLSEGTGVGKYRFHTVAEQHKIHVRHGLSGVDKATNHLRTTR